MTTFGHSDDFLHLGVESHAYAPRLYGARTSGVAEMHSHRFADSLGLPGDLFVGEAEDRQAPARRFPVAGPVRAKGRAIGVVGVAVDLDHQALGAPEEVDLVGADTDVHLGLGMPCSRHMRRKRRSRSERVRSAPQPRSRRVRAWVVTGMFRRRVVSCGVSVVER